MKKALGIFLLLACSWFCSAQKKQLEQNFAVPPSTVKTSVYWYWMCGNISEEGVIKDLEAMKKVGINRAFIGNIYFEPYEGGRNVKLMSDEWWRVTHAALKRAAELDIEIGIFNSPGWSQAGGPWVKSSAAMRYLASSELRIKGGTKIVKVLEMPDSAFQDVKVIAYPAPANDLLVLNQNNCQIKVTPSLPQAEKMFDGEKISGVNLPENIDVTVDFMADADFTANSLTIYPTHNHINTLVDLQAKVGSEYKSLTQFHINWYFLSLIVGFQPHAPVVISFDETTAKEFRIKMKNARNEGGIAEIELGSSPRIEHYAQKTLAKMSQSPLPLWNHYTWRDQPESCNLNSIIDPLKVIDLSHCMTPEGKLVWNAPAGDWVILRTGMVPTGVTNNPAGPDGTGLEVDKMNKAHLGTHFDAFIGKILNRIPAEDRKTFKVVVQDSYESGGQNFTDGFLVDFKAKYGYDALPFLPTYFGKVVGNRAQSDRFLWDLRRLVADKIAYDYVGAFRDLCHKNGLTTWLENYGHWGFASEFLMYGGQSDEVGGEYWLASSSTSWENDLGIIENRAASSCAHIYGKNLVSAESNTSGGPAFARVPADTKQRTDKFFAEGVNNTLLHVYVHQPDTNRFPGTNAWFGTEFNRENTWFTHIDLYLDYIKRCNFMLRQGLNVADVAYFIGEDTPKMTGIQNPKLPHGFQFDYINAEVLIRDAKVENGLLTLPHGTAYKVLVLPEVATMRPVLLAKINQLITDGAIVLGPAPTHSPSLQNQPEADALVKNMALQLWGNRVGVQSRKIGKGQLFSGMSLEEVFTQINLIADCKVNSSAPIHYGHRKTKNEDIYFISNQGDVVHKSNIQFRVKGGMQPELWDPITGTIRKLTAFHFDNETTTVPITLDVLESAFIVFRSEGLPISGTDNFPNPIKTVLLKPVWEINFNGKLTNPAPLRLTTLPDFSKSEVNLIKYFSGNIVYSSTFEAETIKGTAVYLDLGEVNKMAKVWINDQYVGGVWTPPYRVEISAVLKKGENNLRIDVVNTWVNRLIGDKNVPKGEQETWVGINSYTPDSPLQKSGLIGPVQLQYLPIKYN